jgi:hypothetical protein
VTWRDYLLGSEELEDAVVVGPKPLCRLIAPKAMQNYLFFL